MTRTATLPDTPVEAPEALIPEAAPLEPTEDYDAAFQAQVSRNLEKKDGKEPEPITEVTDAGAAAPAGEVPSAPKVEAAPAAPAGKSDDWIDLLPADRRDAARARLAEADAEKARAAKLDLDNRSLAGRISAYQRRYEEAAGKRPVEVAAKATVEQSAEWTQFKEDYPDIAKAIEARVPAEAGTTPQLQQVVEYVEQQKRERFLHDAWEAVESIHPGWRETGKTKEFQAWKASSPTYEKLASSDDIADAVALFDLYRATAPTAAPKADPAAQASAAALAARRAAQADGAQAPNSRGASPNENVDMTDPDQLFAFYAQKAAKRMQSRYR